MYELVYYRYTKGNRISQTIMSGSLATLTKARSNMLKMFKKKPNEYLNIETK